LIRTDILGDKKCVHVKVTRDTHLKLREKLFSYNLSIQSVFDEFARLIVEEDTKALKILEKLAVNKALASLEKPVKKHQYSRNSTVEELDHNTLYSMITSENTKRKKKDDDGTV